LQDRNTVISIWRDVAVRNRFFREVKYHRTKVGGSSWLMEARDLNEAGWRVNGLLPFQDGYLAFEHLAG